MGYQLSEEEKRRVEQEERLRLAENAYRMEVRERLTSAPPERKKSGKTTWIVVALLFILWVMSKSH